jgi:SAM-dependent methyltransferase
LIGSDSNALRFWEDRYQTNNIPWDRGGINPALTTWLASDELQPCRIFVPGCGNGYEVIELSRRGFTVTAVDFAPSAVNRLEQGIAKIGLSAQVIEADVLVWDPEQPFDAIYEQTCLCALPPKLWPKYCERLYRWLKPNGKLFALFMQTNQAGGPPYHCDMAEMRMLFSDNRWQWPESSLGLIPHPVGFHELAAVLIKKS